MSVCFKELAEVDRLDPPSVALSREPVKRELEGSLVEISERQRLATGLMTLELRNWNFCLLVLPPPQFIGCTYRTSGLVDNIANPSVMWLNCFYTRCSRKC